MTDMRSHSQTVHRSLLQRDLMFGIPQTGFLFLFILSVIFIYAFRFYLSAIPIAALYIAARQFTKKDQYLIDICIENIRQKEVLIP